MAPATSPWALAAILTWRRVLGVAQGLGCGQAPGCYPDMVPAASPWALAAILTWRRVLGVAQGLGCGQS